MDYATEIQTLKSTIAEYELVIHELSAPIIPSIMDNTILVPIAGPLNPTRLESVRTKVLGYFGDHREMNCVVFDFTGVESKDLAQMDFSVLSSEIRQLNASLKLMGIRPIYVGFNPQLVQEIVHSGVHVEIDTYVNFKTALTVLFKSKGISF